MRAKDFAVVVQYGNFLIHFDSFHDALEEAHSAAIKKRADLGKKKKLRGGSKPHVTVWRQLEVV